MGGTTDQRRSGSGSPTKSWLDSPFALAEFSALKTSPSNSTVPSDYKPLLGSNFKIPKKGENPMPVDEPKSPVTENFKKYLQEKLKDTKAVPSEQDEAQKTSLANALAQLESKKQLENLQQRNDLEITQVEPTPKIEYQL